MFCNGVPHHLGQSQQSLFGSMVMTMLLLYDGGGFNKESRLFQPGPVWVDFWCAALHWFCFYNRFFGVGYIERWCLVSWSYSYSCGQATCFGEGSIDNVFESFPGFSERIRPDCAEKVDVPTFSGNLLLDANISAAMESITIGCNRYLFVFSQWCPIGQTNWTGCCWELGGAMSLAIIVRGFPTQGGMEQATRSLCSRVIIREMVEKWFQRFFIFTPELGENDLFLTIFD